MEFHSSIDDHKDHHPEDKVDRESSSKVPDTEVNVLESGINTSPVIHTGSQVQTDPFQSDNSENGFPDVHESNDGAACIDTDREDAQTAPQSTDSKKVVREEDIKGFFEVSVLR